MRLPDFSAYRNAVVSVLLWFMSLLVSSLTLAQSITPSPGPPGVTSQGVRQQLSHGSVALRLETDHRELGVTDHLRLMLTADTPTSVQVTFPKVEATLGPFMVHHHATPKPQIIAPDRQRWHQIYTLEATHAGVLTIPPLTVDFHVPAAANLEGIPSHMTTAAETITVTSIVPEDADVTALKPIADVVALPAPGVPWWWWLLLGGAGAFGLAGGLWWWRRWRRQKASLPPQPAHVLALQALQRLQQRNLIVQGRIEEFYVQLSTILRRYIEWRFGVRAPEQTTEEFLAAVLTTGGLMSAHRELLSDFLQHCDLVKFARYQPDMDESRLAFESARTFVQQTADAQVTVALPAAETYAL